MKKISVLLLLLVGCGPTAFRALPQPDRDEFQRCFATHRIMWCSGSKAIEQVSCRDRLEREYAHLETVDARQHWLAQRCGS